MGSRCTCTSLTSYMGLHLHQRRAKESPFNWADKCQRKDRPKLLGYKVHGASSLPTTMIAFSFPYYIFLSLLNSHSCGLIGHFTTFFATRKLAVNLELWWDIMIVTVLGLVGHISLFRNVNIIICLHLLTSFLKCKEVMLPKLLKYIGEMDSRL